MYIYVYICVFNYLYCSYPLTVLILGHSSFNCIVTCVLTSVGTSFIQSFMYFHTNINVRSEMSEQDVSVRTTKV